MKVFNNSKTASGATDTFTNIKFVRINATTTNNFNTIVTGVTGKRIRVFGVWLVSANSVPYSFYSSTTTILGVMQTNNNTPNNMFSPYGLMQTAVGEDFTIATGVGQTLQGLAIYAEI